VGLVSELDPCTSEIADYRILTDILVFFWTNWVIYHAVQCLFD
jgi:hypothetical protein